MNTGKIDYPSKEEIEIQIHDIIEYGLPAKRSSFHTVLALYKELGFRVIFQGMANVIFVSVMMFFLITAAAFPIFYTHRIGLYGWVFMFSPLLYQILCLLSIWKEKQTNTYDIKMVCRYTVHHLSALRMLVFSCMAILANLAVVFTLHQEFSITLILQLLLASVSSLFLYAVISIALIIRSRRISHSYLLIPAWVLFHVFLLYKGGRIYQAFVEYVPVAVHCMVGIALVILYLRYLGIMLTRKMELIS